MIEYRDAQGKRERFAAGARQLVALNVDVIVAPGTLAPLAAKRATATIPSVVPTIDDPVADGLVESLARPGGDVTRLTNLSGNLVGKCMQLLKQAVPGATCVAVLTHQGSATAKTEKNWTTQAQAAGRSLGFAVQPIDGGRPLDLDRASAEMTRWHAHAPVVMPGATLFSERTHITSMATKAVYAYRENVVPGGWMSYGPDLADQFRPSAADADRVFKGARPADLPIEQPTKCQLVINPKAAKALGLMIPSSVLAPAHQVIQ